MPHTQHTHTHSTHTHTPSLHTDTHAHTLAPQTHTLAPFTHPRSPQTHTHSNAHTQSNTTLMTASSVDSVPCDDSPRRPFSTQASHRLEQPDPQVTGGQLRAPGGSLPPLRKILWSIPEKLRHAFDFKSNNPRRSPQAWVSLSSRRERNIRTLPACRVYVTQQFSHNRTSPVT